MSLPNQNSEIEVNEVYKNPIKAMKGASNYFIKNITNSHETVDLQIIGVNQFIGEEDCATNKLYHTTV